MYELNGEKYSAEQIQEAAAKYNMEFNTYLETMKGKGMQTMTGDMTDEDAINKKANDLYNKGNDSVYNTDLTQEEVESYQREVSDIGGLGIDKVEINATNREGESVPAITKAVDENGDYRKDKDGNYIYRRTKNTMSVDEVEELASKSYKKLLDSDEYINGYSEKAMEMNAPKIQDIIAQARKDHDVTDPQGLSDANKDVNKQINLLIQESAAADEEFQSRTKKYNQVIGKQYGPELQGRAIVEKRQDLIDKLAEDSWMQTLSLGVLSNDWHAGVANLNAQLGTSWNGFWNGNYGETIQKNKRVLAIINGPNGLTPTNIGGETKYVAGGTKNQKTGQTSYRYIANSQEELKVMIEKSNKSLIDDQMYNQAQNVEYQKTMAILGSPTLFKEDSWDLDFSTDKYQELLTTQGGQMALGMLSFGGSTLIQEAGGAMDEMAQYHAAKRRFPDLEPEERGKAFFALDQEEKSKLIVEAMNNGDINYEDAMKTGGLNAGFDLVSNFFVFTKAAKGVKFLPKAFARMFAQKAYQKAMHYTWKNMGIDIAKSVLSEVVTENMQELTSMYYVGKNTNHADNLSNGFNVKGFFSDISSPEGLKRIAETTFASAIVPGTLVGGSKILGATYKTAKSASMDYLAKNDKAHLRNYLNKRMKAVQNLIDKGVYTKTEGEQQLQLLELTEQVQNSTKNKYVTGKNKVKIFENLLSQEKLEQELEVLGNEKNPSDKNKQRSLDIKEELQTIARKNTDIRFLDTIDKSGKTFAQWINDQNEGLFKDKRMNLFTTVKELKTYVGGRIKSINKQLKKDPKNKRLKNELKELQAVSLKELMKGSKSKANGANTGNNAWVVKELVDRKGGQGYGANTIHHEALHFVLDGFKNSDLTTFREGVLKEMQDSKDPKMIALAALVDSRLNEYKAYSKQTKGTADEFKFRKGSNIENQEFFTALSDAMRKIDATQLEKDPLLARAMHKLGLQFQKFFKDNGVNLDFSNLDGENTLTFLRDFNDFNGRNRYAVPTMPKLYKPKGKQVPPGDPKFSLSEIDSEKVNELWAKNGLAASMDILDILKPTAIGITGRYRERPNYAVMKDILLDEIMTGPRGMLDVIMSYEKYQKENKEAAPLSGYLNKSFSTKTGFKRYIEIANRVLGEGDQSQFTTDINDAKNITNEETVAEEDNRAPRTLRKDIGISDDIVTTVKQAVERTFGLKLPQVSDKDFKKALQDNFRTKLFKVIKNSMGTRTAYKMFISKNAKAMYKALSQSTLNKRFPQFATPVLDKDGKQKRENTPQGNAVFSKKAFNQKEFENYFLGNEVGASTKGTRKDALAEALAEELGFDATMEVLQSPSVTGKFKRINELQGFELPANYLAILDKAIDRDRDSKFSLAVANLPEDLLQNFQANRKEFFNNINKIGYTQKAIGEAFDLTYGKGTFGKNRSLITKDMAKLLKQFLLAKESYKSNKLPFKYKIQDYINTIDKQLDDNVTIAKMFGLEDTMAAYFRDEKQLKNYRNYISQFALHLYGKNNGDVTTTLIQLIQYKAAFENGTGAGKRAAAFGNKTDYINNLLSIIAPELTSYSFSSKGLKGTGNRVLTMKFQGQEDVVITVPVETNQKTTAAHLDGTIDLNDSLSKAKDSQAILVSMFEFMAENKANEQFTDIDAAMMVTGLLGNMKTVLRSSANFKYISNVLPSKKPGDYRYEHLIPARVVAFYMTEKYFNGNQDINTKQLLEDYSVAVIPLTMDEKMGKLFGQTMNLDYVIGDHPSKRYYNILTRGEMQFAIKDLSTGKIYGQTYADEYVGLQKVKNENSKFSLAAKGKSLQEQINIFKNLAKALEIADNPNAPVKGISVFDFDDTLATTNSKIKVLMPDGTSTKINATQFALESANLEQDGALFDFTEFNEVIDGKKGPWFDLAQKRKGKFGNKDIFVLTARPAEAAGAIHAFLKGVGLEIPIENITGLANGTPESKADWMLGKAALGYNNFYFADDAYKNVASVQEVLNVIDVKNKVEQAKFSLSLEQDINQIIEDESGVKSYKNFSVSAGQRLGAKVRSKFRFFLPPSAEDFLGLLYDLLSKGKKGDAQLVWFNKHLISPFARAYRAMNIAKTTISNDFRGLNKAYKSTVKKLGKESGYKNFTYDQAVRVYLWNKFGMKIPGISKQDQKALIKLVKEDPTMQEFADNLANITRLEEGYPAPSDNWLSGTTASDLNDVVDKIGRKKYLKEFNENVEKIFTPAVFAKLEAVYGEDWVNAMKDMLYRMQKGSNRSFGKSKIVNSFMNWVNNSVGAIMFLNMRSAILQTISATNYINMGDNNLFKAAKAFANQKQYWKDFVMLFNSPTLKQRRSGLQTDVNEAEIANAASTSKNKAAAVLAYLLKKGFTPTQIADSFAIASGGATMYRNRFNKYVKEGMSKKDAHNKAMEDFLNITESTQQSSRPDLISEQQAGPLGRLLLAFQNTPMQYNRLIKKAARDLKNGRGDWKTNVSKILYYGMIQNLFFQVLQNAMFGLFWEDEEEEEERYDKKKTRIANGMVDSIMRGSGVYGAIASTVKNVILKYIEQENKGWNADHTYTIIEAVNMSPPLGSKLRKIYGAMQTWKFNKKVIPNMSAMDIANPVYDMIGQLVSGTTNVPLDRAVRKMVNLKYALDDEHATWQRIFMALGWTSWDLGVVNPDIQAAKDAGSGKIRKEKLGKETIKKEKIK